jgi:hypothetical protein
MSELRIKRPKQEVEREEKIARLMRDLLAGLPEGAATLEVTHDGCGAIFRLKPSNRESAEFGIHYDGSVDVFFGKFGTGFEVDFGPRSANPDFAAALAFAEKVGLAVIAGKCKERAGFTGIRGTVEIEGSPYRSTHFFYFRLFPKTIRYAPYCPASAKAQASDPSQL